MTTPAMPRPQPQLGSYENAARLGRFAATLDRNAIPNDVWAHASTVVLDTIGCIIGGAPTPPAAPVLRVVHSLAGRGEAHVLGTEIVTDCVNAAFANAYLADVVDFEDTIVSHRSASAVPAALAVGERVAASGEQMLCAVIAAYEVGMRIQRASMPSFERRAQVPSEFAWKAYPASVAAGCLTGLDEAEWVEALGYAGAAAAVPAATSTAERVMSSDTWAPDALTRGLGTTWVVAEAQLKPYPCCRFLHPTLDAVADATEDVQFSLDAVAQVRVRTFATVVREFADYRPDGMIDAEFSLPYAVAMQLLGIPRDARWYAPELLRDQRVLDLMDRVHIVEDQEHSDLFARERRSSGAVEIELVDGRSLSARSDRARGGPEAPLSGPEAQDKFLGLTAPVLGTARAREAYDTLLALDGLDDVRRLGRLLVPAPIVRSSRRRTRSPRSPASRFGEMPTD